MDFNCKSCGQKLHIYAVMYTVNSPLDAFYETEDYSDYYEIEYIKHKIFCPRCLNDAAMDEETYRAVKEKFDNVEF